jgi:protein-L-isoaspartate(D-aspartate) O-methyltransferase
MPQFESMRHHMVKRQLLPEGVTNPAVLEAFSEIAREKFVPQSLARIAYMDAHFPLNKRRFLLRPATLARLLEACRFLPSHKILYIGCGSGYGPALLAHMGLSGIALDCEDIFTQETERLLQELEYSSLGVVLGPLEEGWKTAGPYDRIFVEGAIDFLPEMLAAQLKKEGELIALNPRGKAIKYVKKDRLSEIYLFDASGPHLPGFKTQKIFDFSGKRPGFVYGKS